MTLQLTTVMYHYVRPAAELPLAGYGGVDTNEFERQLDEISRRATPVTWPAVVAALDEREPLPDDAVLLTFDDGLADHAWHVLPRLVYRRLSAVFFPLARSPRDGLTLAHGLHLLIAALGSDEARQHIVERLSDEDRQTHARLEATALSERPTDPEDAWKRPLQRELAGSAEPIVAGVVRDKVGPADELARALYLSESDTAELVRAGMYLGGHGCAHLWLDHEDVATVRTELQASAEFVDRLQSGPRPFAYPFGGVSETAAREVERAGFRAAFTTVRHSHGPFRLGRVDAESAGWIEALGSARA